MTKKTGVIGHRGAAKMALENTAQSIVAALELRVDAIEVDVRRTKDGQLVLLHDPSTERVTQPGLPHMLARQHTLKELQQAQLKDGQRLLSLEKAMQLVGSNTPLVLDIKSRGCADEIIRLSSIYPEVKIELTSRIASELAKLHQVRSDWPIYVLERFNPVEIFYAKRRVGAVGISVNKWIINPFTYWLARARNLEVRVYTVNLRMQYRILKILYPAIVIYTDAPARFVGKRASKPTNKRFKA